MQKNKYILILAFMAVFLITNGTFFVLCEKDIVLDYINKFGDWTNAALWHSSKAFLYYAAADTFYNIRYIAPKLAYALAPIKWADRLNGWLGGSSTGELEKHLAQGQYHPLYKDALNGLYSNIGVPLYNNIYAPILGIKPKKEINQVFMPEPLVFEVVKEKTTLINKVQIVEKHDEDVLALRDEINKARVALDKLAISKSLNIDDVQIMNEIRSLSKFEEAITYTTTQLQKSFVHYSMFLADEDRGAEINSHKIKYLEFHRENNFVKVYFDHPGQLFVGVSLAQFKQEFPIISRLITDIVTPTHSHREEIGADGVWRIKPLSDWAYIDVKYDIIRQSWLRTDFHINPENCLLKVLGGPISFERFDTSTGRAHQSGLLPEKIREHLMHTLEREQTEFDNQLVSIENAFLNYGTRNNPQDDIPSNEEQSSNDIEPSIIDGSIAGETINWLPAASVGVLTTLSVGQALVVFSYFFGIEIFQTMIQNNIHVQEALINLYHANNMEMPTILSDAINNSPAHSTNSFTFDSNSPTNGTSSGGDSSFIKYIGYGVVALGAIGIAWYLTKHGMDSTPAVETAKNLQETLREKYVNFK